MSCVEISRFWRDKKHGKGMKVGMFGAAGEMKMYGEGSCWRELKKGKPWVCWVGVVEFVGLGWVDGWASSKNST